MAANGESEKLPKTLVGIAGEYLVAGELSRRGYLAAVTLRNTKGVDILASSGDASKSVGIQVKTIQSKRRVWPLSEKADAYTPDNVLYVFVNLNDGGAPTYHVVPSVVVAEYSRQWHSYFLDTTRRDGRPHKDSGRRAFKDTKGSFRDRWDLLGLDREPPLPLPAFDVDAPWKTQRRTAA
jgi:hypothetical protein